MDPLLVLANPAPVQFNVPAETKQNRQVERVQVRRSESIVSRAQVAREAVRNRILGSLRGGARR